MPTPSPSPLTSLSPPFAEERLARCTTPSALPSPPLPPPLHMPPPIDHRDDILEIEMPPRKRLCLSTLGSRYGIRDTWIDRAETVLEIVPMTMGEWVDLLMEDMIAHKETIQIIEDEAYAAREDWAHSIGLSQAVHFELQTHQEQMQQTKIAELRETDCRRQAQMAETLRVMGDMRREMGDMHAELRQAQMAETLRVMGDMRREMGDMHAELLALRGQSRRVGQPGGDARVLNHQDAPRDADNHI
nr:hypothetical protein [Tanacetum cinerariifolium]